MMRRVSFPLYILVASLSLAFTHTLSAEEVRMPMGSQGDQNVATPGRAWTQAKVQQSFGTPISRRGPVGDPAITTWEYVDFNVYFEHDKVIHSVKRYSASN